MNYRLVFEAIVMGLVSLMLGIIIFNLTINKNNKDNIKPFGLNIVFFSTGFLLHIIFELINKRDEIF